MQEWCRGKWAQTPGCAAGKPRGEGCKGLCTDDLVLMNFRARHPPVHCCSCSWENMTEVTQTAQGPLLRGTLTFSLLRSGLGVTYISQHFLHHVFCPCCSQCCYHTTCYSVLVIKSGAFKSTFKPWHQVLYGKSMASSSVSDLLSIPQTGLLLLYLLFLPHLLSKCHSHGY